MNIDTNSEVPERTLLYFPIIHTQADMGDLKELVRDASFKKSGRVGWQRKVDLILKMWEEIEKVIDGLALFYERVRLYQDGLPVCGKEPEIVRELAKGGSINHQLLVRLMDKGATIMGTESAELLVKEYELVKQVLNARNTQNASACEAHHKSLGDSLLKQRDQFIADRINKTLLPGETGILFLGMLHTSINLLEKDIQVVYPINRPINRSTTH